MKNKFEEPDPNFQVVKNGEKVRTFLKKS